MGIFDIFGNLFGWIMWLCYELVKNYGIALILFTLITKAAMLPLSIKQQKSSAKMAYFRPKMEAIQKKYANNRDKQNAELAKLYEEEGYSPMAGCLPMLITFPVLFGVVGVVYNPLSHILRFSTGTINAITAIANSFAFNADKLKNYPQLKILSLLQDETHGAEFVSKIAEFDPAAAEALRGFDNGFLGLDFSAIPSYTSILILVPILAALAGLLSSWISMRVMRTGDDSAAAAGTNKVMLLIMPLITFFFAMSLPVGIGFYWIISNLLAMVQSVLLGKIYNPRKLAEKIAAEQEALKEKKKAQKKAQAELRKKMYGEKESSKKEENMTAEEKAEAKKALEDAKEKLRLARMRDAEKYGEAFVDVTDDDLK